MIRAGWRIAANSLVTRPGLNALLALAVALAVSFVIAVSSTLHSVDTSIRAIMRDTLGVAQLRLRHQTGGRLDAEVLDTLRAWPEVERIAPRLTTTVLLRNPRTDRELVFTAHGVDLETEFLVHPVNVTQGAIPAAPDEAIIDPRVAEELNLAVGDEVIAGSWGREATLRIAGVHQRLNLPILQKPEIRMPRETLGRIAGPGYAGRVTMADVVIAEGFDPRAVLAERRDELELPAELVESDLLRAGVDRNLRGIKLTFWVSSLLCFMTASFIILTGMTTAVRQRIRQLGILRAIGASRAQIFFSQLLSGSVIAMLGGLAGIPLGALFTAILGRVLGDLIREGVSLSAGGVVAALGVSAAAGVAGSLLPAWRASRVSPLTALSVSAQAPSTRGVLAVTAIGVVLIAAQYLALRLPENEQVGFWSYITVGIPALVTGFFLLGVPAILLLTALLSPIVARALAVPSAALRGALEATPFRHGFTAGAMMLGLAVATALWINGYGVIRDFIEPIEFPDAFVQSWTGLDDSALAEIRALPFVENACAVGLLRLESPNRHLFGVRGIDSQFVNFITFEPEPFFSMTHLEWIEGSQETALPRLLEGGAILVAKEFLAARGIGVGQRLNLGPPGNVQEFEIVGVVSSPGLDLATNFFGIEGEFHEQAISSVFATRADSIRLFRNDEIHLVQFDLAAEVSDEEAERQMTALLGPVRFGSGRMIHRFLNDVMNRFLFASSFIALAALLVAGLGTANVIAANVASRQFEYGVIRAVGSTPGLTFRLILAEALVIGLTACVVGTLLGVAGAYNGVYLNRVLAGVVFSPRPAPVPLAIAWAVTIAFTILAAVPPAFSLLRRSTRDLLADRSIA